MVTGSKTLEHLAGNKLRSGGAALASMCDRTPDKVSGASADVSVLAVPTSSRCRPVVCDTGRELTPAEAAESERISNVRQGP